MDSLTRDGLDQLDQLDHPARTKKKERKADKIRMHYSLACRVHQVEFTVMVHHLWNDGIPPELVYE